jgi:rhodanese-related sulfurtransferase
MVTLKICYIDFRVTIISVSLRIKLIIMKKYLIVLIIALATSLVFGQEKGMHNVVVNEFQNFKKLSKKNLLDVRTPQEFEKGHIEGAKNVDYFSKGFKSELEKLDKSVPVYVYCRSGGRSAKAMQIMKEMGFESVYNLQGGFLAWSQKK